MINLLRRLFYAPLLFKLHIDHTKLHEKLTEQQKRMWLCIDLGSPAHVMDKEKKETERLAEQMFELDKRMVKLWRKP